MENCKQLWDILPTYNVVANNSSISFKPNKPFSTTKVEAGRFKGSDVNKYGYAYIETIVNIGAVTSSSTYDEYDTISITFASSANGNDYINNNSIVKGRDGTSITLASIFWISPDVDWVVYIKSNHDYTRNITDIWIRWTLFSHDKFKNITT